MSPPTPYTTTLLPPPGPLISKPRSTLSIRPETPHTFIDAMSVRNDVFVNEQGCSAEEELDDDDARSWHWVLYTTTQSDGKLMPVGVIRLVPPPHPPHFNEIPASANGERHNHDIPHVKITRVAVLPEYRGKGLSRILVDTLLDWAAGHAEELSSTVAGEGERWDGLVLVHAQVSVEKVYEKMGFVTDASMGTWLEEGIDHVAMWRRIAVL
ncbi:hypothetical protein FQN54_001328 [Arachnomyces sp. PD_36]|nr:hypothetical protein FQN54_001328 [Arachnomyces sp. PD_36]